MRRGLQIVVSLLAILLLAHPFDCLANVRTPDAMRCCLKGQCAPTAKADGCCKNTVPGTNHFLIAKALTQVTPLVASASCLACGAEVTSSHLVPTPGVPSHTESPAL